MQARATRALLLAATLGSAVTAASSAGAADTVNIPFQKTQLPNGMTVILHEDHSLPIAVVNIGYWVGSRFEQVHRTGFAHLFEHLMFMGTKRAPSFDKWMEEAGGWNNAGTDEDRTDYYDVGPSNALPLFLWLEADRMRDLGPLMTKEKLDTQRDVVRNERRQRVENAPYGNAENHLQELVYAEGHPYHHPVIGTHEDLEAAEVDDVKQFFATYYDPANASLVVAGDFDPKATLEGLKASFGSIPSRGKPKDPGAPGFDPNVTTLKSVVRETMEDSVELSRITMAWQSPKAFAPGDAELGLLGSVLSKGKASRLYGALVYDRKLAQDVSVSQDSRVLGSMFRVVVTARPGVPLDTLEAAIDAELKKVMTAPVKDEELTRAKNAVETGFVARLERVAERAAILNEYEAELGDPGYAPRDLERYRGATPEGIRAVAAKVIDLKARVIQRVVPRKKAPVVKSEPQKAAPAAASKAVAK